MVTTACELHEPWIRRLICSLLEAMLRKVGLAYHSEYYGLAAVDLLIEDRIAHQETIHDCRGGGLCFSRGLGSFGRIKHSTRYMRLAPRCSRLRWQSCERLTVDAELLALQEQHRRARQPRPDVRVPDHQDASRDADSHL
ncbi:hypothetical protein Tco_0546143 [Tanacetum coccineum]